MTVRQAADVLSVTRQRVHELIAEGRIVVSTKYKHQFILDDGSVRKLRRELDAHPRRGGGKA